MFDWLRNLTKSEEERRQEELTAYVDGRLSAADQQRFEAQLADDEALRQEVELQRELKTAMSQMPTLRAPRNFTLDPAVYGAAEPTFAMQLYPKLRTATAIMAVLLVGIVALDFLTTGGGGALTSAPADVAMVQQESAAEPMVEATFPAAAGELTDMGTSASNADEAAERIIEEEVVIETEVEAEEVMEDEAMDEEMSEGIFDDVASDITADDGGTDTDLFEEAPAPVPPAEGDAELDLAPTASPDSALLTEPIGEAAASASEGVAGGGAEEPPVIASTATIAPLATLPPATVAAVAPRPEPTATFAANRVAPSAVPTQAVEVVAVPTLTPLPTAPAAPDDGLIGAVPVEDSVNIDWITALQVLLGLAVVVLFVTTLIVRRRM